MKTKNIFKTLAFAMLMPAMLLTTACSSDDSIINTPEKTENTTGKGYEIPITINATRQDATTTRATYNPDTKKLEYSTGDQLYVIGNHSTAGKYYGTLDWIGGIIFSGTITTANPYSGTGVELLSSSESVRAILLPAGYTNYQFIKTNEDIDNPISVHLDKTFAASKTIAIEQFSYEFVNGYSDGFALAPQNAILNFTLTGLTPNTEFAIQLSNPNFTWFNGNVTTNDSGTATFAIGIFIPLCTDKGIDDLYNGWVLKVNDEVMPALVTSSKPLVAGHIYNITRSASGTPTPAAGQFSVSATEKVTFSSGNLQATWDGTSWTWHFAENQWDYIGNAEGNTKVSDSTPFVSGYSGSSTTVDLFGWVGASSTWTGAAQYGIISSYATNKTDGYGTNPSEDLKSDWGNTISDGYTWFTLTSAEWTYLFNTRTTGGTVFGTSSARYAYATINTDGTGVNGMILFPDGVDIASTEVTTAGTVNNTSAWGTKCTSAQWSALAAKGCVFLPAAGYRSGTSVNSAGSRGRYWSSSPDTEYVYYAYSVYFDSGSLYPANNGNRSYGFSVRLVREVK